MPHVASWLRIAPKITPIIITAYLERPWGPYKNALQPANLLQEPPKAQILWARFVMGLKGLRGVCVLFTTISVHQGIEQRSFWIYHYGNPTDTLEALRRTTRLDQNGNILLILSLISILGALKGGSFDFTDDDYCVLKFRVRYPIYLLLNPRIAQAYRDLGRGENLGPFLFFGFTMLTYAYIDGRNMFHTLEELKIDGYNFNYRAFVESFALKPGADGRNHRDLRKISFYGARYPAVKDQRKHHRDDKFYKHLQDHQKIIVREGRFRIDDDGSIQEKGVDVLLATDAIADAFYQCQHLFIFSGDTDLLPALEFICQKFSCKVFVVGPRKLEVYKDLKNVMSLQVYHDVYRKFRTPGSFDNSKQDVEDLAAHFQGGGKNFGKHKPRMK